MVFLTLWIRPVQGNRTMNNAVKILLSDLNLAEYLRKMARLNVEGEIIEQNAPVTRFTSGLPE